MKLLGFCLLFFLSFTEICYGETIYKAGIISLKGFSGFPLSLSNNKEALVWSKPIITDPIPRNDRYSIYLGNNRSNIFIDRSNNYFTILTTLTPINIKYLRLDLSSSFSDGSITPIINHTFGFILPGLVTNKFYFSKSFTETYKTGENYLLSINYSIPAIEVTILINKLSDYLTAKQTFEKRKLIIAGYYDISHNSLISKNTIKITKINNSYKRFLNLNLENDFTRLKTSLGYEYKDLYKHSSLSVKHTISFGVKIYSYIILNITGNIILINTPYYKFKSELIYEYKDITIIPYINLEFPKPQKHNPGIKIKLNNKVFTSTFIFQYLTIDKDNWNFQLNISKKY